MKKPVMLSRIIISLTLIMMLLVPIVAKANGVHTVIFVVQNGPIGIYATQTTEIQVADGDLIPQGDIPNHTARRGWYFVGWEPSDPNTHGPVIGNVTFTMRFEQLWWDFTFIIEEGGIHEGTTVHPERDGFRLPGNHWIPDPANPPLPFHVVPSTQARPGYRFMGWYLVLEDETRIRIGYCLTELPDDHPVRSFVDFTGNYTFVATFEPNQKDIEVTKIWVGDVPGNRPGSITVELLVWNEDSDDYVSMNPIQTIELNAVGNWIGAFTDLPVFDGDGPDRIRYNIRELNVPTGYVPVSGELTRLTEVDGNLWAITLTNTFIGSGNGGNGSGNGNGNDNGNENGGGNGNGGAEGGTDGGTEGGTNGGAKGGTTGGADNNINNSRAPQTGDVASVILLFAGLLYAMSGIFGGVSLKKKLKNMFW